MFEFEFDIDKVSYEDGVKVYFKNGGWVIVWFFGIEFLLCIFVEMVDKDIVECVF